MSFINWGNETPEQRARRYQLEDEAIFEQRAASIMAAAAAAAGSSRREVPVNYYYNYYYYGGLADGIGVNNL